MSMLDRIRDGFKYLDKNGLKHLVEKIKLHDVHWTGTHAEYEAVKDTLPDYTILHFTDDYEDSVGVVDKIEDNNMNGVTSNAVSKLGKIYTKTTVQEARAASSVAEWYDNPSVDISDLPNGLYLCFVRTACHSVEAGLTDLLSVNGFNLCSMSAGDTIICGSFPLNKTSAVTTLANRTYKQPGSMVREGTIIWQFTRLTTN